MTGEEPDKESRALFGKISQMTMAEKIKLALTGNKEARTILMRDGNRVIQMAVAQNPRLTDKEAIQIAKSRTIDETVLRYLANDRRWHKLYPLKVEMVKNPKTPLMMALRLIPLLREAELKQIAKSKDVLRAISSQALRHLSQRG